MSLLPQDSTSFIAQPLPHNGEVHDPEIRRLSGYRIMIVDDDDLNVQILREVLETAGYRDIVSTTIPEVTLDLINIERPDLLLLTCAMTEERGLSVLGSVRGLAQHQHMPVVVLATENDLRTRHRALELGANDYLSKPVDSHELALRLRNTLATKAHMDRLASYDALTGLPNREQYLAHLDWFLRFAGRHQNNGAVLYIGMDRFRQINDALGTSLGDRLLRIVAQRLDVCIRESDYLARSNARVSPNLLSRLGGDEFTVLLTNLAQPDHSGMVAQRILEAVAEPVNVGDRELVMSCSIGISIFPDDGLEKDTVLNAAAAAMRQVKLMQKGRYQYYSSDMNTRALNRLSLEGELRKAIELDELELHLQPKVSLDTGVISGAEALVRWNHPEQGLMNPVEFIPLSEETGLIHALGDWVLDAACKQIRAWQDQGTPLCRIAINVSSHQFRQSSFIERVQSVLESSGIDPKWLSMELTETAIMENASGSVNLIRQLRDMGIRLAIDDFGMGYSSFSYLRRFAMDDLKIDRSFLKGVPRNVDSTAIVTAIIAMAHRLGMSVTAEGVENQAQYDFLKQQGCDDCQGFMISRPLPLPEFDALLERSLRQH